MTQLLEQVFVKYSKELSQTDQDAVANMLLKNFKDMVEEARWQHSFATSQDALEKLADEAEEDIAAGRTEPLENLFQ